MTDAAVTDVEYDAKEDRFTVSFDLTWQSDSGTPAHTDGIVFLHNDGYGQYVDTYLLSGAESASPEKAPTVTVNVE